MGRRMRMDVTRDKSTGYKLADIVSHLQPYIARAVNTAPCYNVSLGCKVKCWV